MTYRIKRIVLLLIFAAGGFVSNAQQFQEHEVKAAFLCNFAKFVEWPANAFENNYSPIIIGIIGEDPFGDIADRIAKSASVKQRGVIIRRYERPEDAFECHVLYVGKLKELELEPFLNKFIGETVLLVGEQDNFCQQGGMINFSNNKMKYGFEIRPKRANQANLKISSKLLGLAIIIE